MEDIEIMMKGHVMNVEGDLHFIADCCDFNLIFRELESCHELFEAIPVYSPTDMMEDCTGGNKAIRQASRVGKLIIQIKLHIENMNIDDDGVTWYKACYTRVEREHDMPIHNWFVINEYRTLIIGK